jgi:hypothetical protein
MLILLAVVLMATSAFAQSGGRLFVQPNGTFATGSPATTDNDSSCDVGVAPAATLLLPYFEVALDSDRSTAVNTFFTITNTSAIPQIAHVVVWTDWSFPVLDFNIWLTGYDVQGLSLWDILYDGEIPPTGADDDDNSPVGIFSETTNDYHDWGADPQTDCDDLPGSIPSDLIEEVQSALTGGAYFLESQVGGEHDNMVGYITVDVAAVCSVALPTDGTDYFEDEILFDNVLIGDYQRINPDVATGNYVAGNPMVHIRAIPEGGDNLSEISFDPNDVNLPFSFYDRYIESASYPLDRRQPLPGVWAARYIDEDGDFDTRIVIWREGVNSADDDDEAEDNSELSVEEMVRFDESENPFVIETSICRISPCPEITPDSVTFPETSAYSINDDSQFPEDPGSDAGGWLYMNLNSGLGDEGLTRPTRIESQNWVIVNMSAESRYGVDFDAAWLGNGCSEDPGIHVNDDFETCDGDGEADSTSSSPCGIGPLANYQAPNAGQGNP